MPKNLRHQPQPLGKKRAQLHTELEYDVLGFLDPTPNPANKTTPVPNVNNSHASEHTRRVVTEWQAHEDFGAEPNDAPPITPDNISLMLPDEKSQDSAVVAGSEPDEDTLAISRHILSNIAQDSKKPSSATIDNSTTHHGGNARTTEELDDGPLKNAGFEEEPPTADDNLSQTLSLPISHPENDSVKVVHTPRLNYISPFYTMLAVWEEHNHVSREAHAQLVEVFQLAHSLEEIQLTTKRKDTLAANLKKSLPLKKLRKMTVKLDPTYLPSRSKLEEDILVFDLPEMVTALLSSASISRDIYRSMAHYTDGPITNPWKAR
ncbi:hypothetical protein F5X96DRAFT_1778 [Biscogniauxia mediterranea]|nr:hypothetical protein F5X96DRAFT_1778 [Biscogniauxia mediterranea]